MMVDGYARRDNSVRDIQPAAIISVDTVSRIARVMTRVKTELNVDCSYSAGDSTVTPAVGEQWYIERFDGIWRLYGRIPHNDPTLLIEAVEGQVSVGGASGPLELNGTVINARGDLTLAGDIDLVLNGTHYQNIDGVFSFSPDGVDWAQVVPDPPPPLPNTDSLPEGTTNLYFTPSRAAAAAPVQSVAGRTGAVVLSKTDVGLSNVDNTTDALKPISTATATALSGKADLVSGTVPIGQVPPIPQSGVTGLTGVLGSLLPTSSFNGLLTSLFGGTSVGSTIQGSAVPALPQSQITGLTSALGSLLPTSSFNGLLSNLFGSPVVGSTIQTTAVPNLPQSQITGLVSSLSSLLPTSSFNGLLTNLFGSTTVGSTIQTGAVPALPQSQITGLVSALGGLLPTTSFDGLLTNLFGSPVVGSTIQTGAVPTLATSKITGLPSALSDLTALGGNFQSLLNVFKGSSGGGIGDATSMLQFLSPGTGIFNAAQLGNIANIPGISGLKISGLSTTDQVPDANILETASRLLFGLAGGITKAGNASYSHEELDEAVSSQADTVQGTAATMEQILAALGTGTPDADDFERASLGALWSVYSTGTGSLTIPNGHDAKWSGTGASSEFVTYKNDKVSATDHQTSTVVLASAVPSYPFWNPLPYGGFFDIWVRMTAFTTYATRTGLRFRINVNAPYNALWSLDWINSGTATNLGSGTMAQPGAGASIAFEAGVNGNPRRFITRLNGTTISGTDITEAGTTSQYGASYRLRGFGGRGQSGVGYAVGVPTFKQWTAQG